MRVEQPVAARHIREVARELRRRRLDRLVDRAQVDPQRVEGLHFGLDRGDRAASDSLQTSIEDGQQELVVIEADAVAVWQWQGWHFSLVWRGGNGRYNNLHLLPTEQGSYVITITTP